MKVDNLKTNLQRVEFKFKKRKATSHIYEMKC